ncbi:transcriptional regulator, LacI family [Nakamurella panacisegetis]|uniref:Transcriptional regulator, LacI family n=1 Tax=Nakamurella panacisegetis TaxID=1090615 RepID=A0A1H0I1I3_9ACTN|nr:LacI family DNA-binding transcriptional regulator [Nakamurella panacisegetis]SDO25245.1 transcriptional regulator, LacI family [Nakamurella panacisegetis]
MSTMREVAALAGVSGKTVSRVINGDRYVSTDVRERVERAIAELRYVPNMLSQAFRNGRDTAIGVAVPTIADAFFAAVVQAISERARARSTPVLITSLGTDAAQEQVAVEALLRRHVAGLIIAPVSADQSYLRPWRETTELVFVDRPPSRIAADSVIEDDEGGAAVAVSHLLSAGHRRIAFLGDGSSVVTTGRRLDGYRTALAGAGIGEREDLVCLVDRTGGDPGSSLDVLLRLDEPPTAVFSSNARLSVALVSDLHRRRRTDLTVVSFGDFPMASALTPAVTVIDQDPALLGRTAADRLFDRIDRPGARRKRQILLPVELRVRPTHTHPRTTEQIGSQA